MWRFMIICSTTLIFTLTCATPPRSSRQNFYNYRTDFDDDQNFAQFEGDTNGNYVSEFGQRVGSRSPTTSDLIQQDEVVEYSDSVIPGADEEETLPSDGRRLKTTWADTSGQRGGGDASYSFGYDLHDQSRHETSDSFGNVNGVYSYIDDEGVYRQISYSAGAGTGFVVHNKHASRVRPPYRGPNSPDPPKIHPSRQPSLGWEEEEQIYPIGPTRPTIDGLNQQRPWSSPPRRRKPAYVVKVRRPLNQDPAWSYFRPPNPGRLAPSRGGGWIAPAKPQHPVKVYPPEDSFGSDSWSDQDPGSSYPKDASYSFAYDAGDHNRHEVSDPWGNVRGSYSYIDPEGLRRTVHYIASSATGFKILKAEPSSIVSTVYRDPSHQHPRPPSPHQPSAFVYHLHPDSGWKPWEATNNRTPQSASSGKPRRPHNSVSQSYHYQSQTIGKKPDEQQTLLKPTTKRQRRPTKHHKPNPEEIQIDQQFSDTDYEIPDSPEPRFESQRQETDIELAESKGPEIKGYRGGYGDKNPLLVVSESLSRPRTAGQENNDEDEKQIMNTSENESSTKRPISIAKMMSMRMSTSHKKSKNRSSRGKSQNAPTTMSNPGRLMHYPKSRNSNNEDPRINADK